MPRTRKPPAATPRRPRQARLPGAAPRQPPQAPPRAAGRRAAAPPRPGSALDYLILGVVKDHPLSGYDLAKMFDYVVRYFWQAEQSQVYRALYRLRDARMVESEVVAQERSPDKKIYRITAEGRRALAAWLRAPAPATSPRRPWLGQLYFADELAAGEIAAILDRRTEELQVARQELESRVQDGDARAHTRLQLEQTGRFPSRALALRYGLDFVRFELDWLQAVRSELPRLERRLRDLRGG
jgi:PadR family transcriptional regulator AphA